MNAIIAVDCYNGCNHYTVWSMIRHNFVTHAEFKKYLNSTVMNYDIAVNSVIYPGYLNDAVCMQSLPTMEDKGVLLAVRQSHDNLFIYFTNSIWLHYQWNDEFHQYR